MAIINADYFLFNTENALVYPKLLRTDMVDATFDWRELPKATLLFSSFGDGKRVQRVRAPWYRLQDALFAGGNFRAIESHENGTTLVLAVRGTWKFTDAEAFAQIRRVIDEENKFWHMQRLSYFWLRWRRLMKSRATTTEVGSQTHSCCFFRTKTPSMLRGCDCWPMRCSTIGTQ